MDMNVNRIRFRHFGRRLSIIAGSIIGLIMIGLFNLIGENTHLFVNIHA